MASSLTKQKAVYILLIWKDAPWRCVVTWFESRAPNVMQITVWYLGNCCTLEKNCTELQEATSDLSVRRTVQRRSMNIQQVGTHAHTHTHIQGRDLRLHKQWKLWLQNKQNSWGIRRLKTTLNDATVWWNETKVQRKCLSANMVPPFSSITSYPALNSAIQWLITLWKLSLKARLIQ